MSFNYIPPVLETTTTKDDALDWNTLPDEECDLNYRSSTARPASAQWQTLGFMLGIPVIALPVVYLLQQVLGSAIATTPVFILSVMIGAAIALTLHLRESPLRLVCLAALAPPLAWLLIVVAPYQQYAPAAMLIMLGVGTPALLWFADTVATHAIYWMSAHYKNDHATMMAWRTDWDNRFTGVVDRPSRRNDLSASQKELHEGVQQTRTAYRRGILFLPLLFVIAGVFILSTSTSEARFDTGFFLAFAVFIALLVGCIVRTIQFPGSLKCTWFYLSDFLWHGSPFRQPPWVFRSPSGDPTQRQIAAGLAMFIVTFTIVPLGDYFLWVYLTPANSFLLPEAMLQDPNPFTLGLTALRGDAHAAFLIAIQYLLLFATPGLFLFLGIHFLAGPAIRAHYLALEAPHAYEHHPEWDRLDGYSERLRNSRNQKERNSIIVARHPTNDYPVLMHLKLAFEHVLMLGATGIGKTVLGLITHQIQLIRRNDGPVVIIDCKGDPVLFHTARIEAERAGRKFKWFTNGLNKSTYVFNAFDKNLYSQLSLQEIVGFLMNALNLHHGSDYARAWFTIASKILLKRSFEETVPAGSARGGHSRTYQNAKFDQIKSFKDLNDVILFLAADGKEFQAAQHLAFLIESLAGFEQLNMTAKLHPDDPAFHNAINMSEALDNNEVIYFYLEGAVDSVTVSEIGRLAIFSLLNACIDYKTRNRKKANAYLLVDEAQHVIAQNITHVLAQARSFGMACFLANQTMSQLNPPGGADLRELVMACTSVKQIFSARDPWLQKYIREMSGKVAYANLSYQNDANDVLGGHLGLDHVLQNEQGQRPVTITPYIGDRLNTQDLLDVNRDPNKCLLSIERAEAFSRWIGFAPVHVDWPLHELEYHIREETDWPEQTPETIMLKSPWPTVTKETFVPKPMLVLPEPEFQKQMKERLKKLQDDLDEED